jgi:hypothetical protein
MEFMPTSINSIARQGLASEGNIYEFAANPFNDSAYTDSPLSVLWSFLAEIFGYFYEAPLKMKEDELVEISKKMCQALEDDIEGSEIEVPIKMNSKDETLIMKQRSDQVFISLKTKNYEVVYPGVRNFDELRRQLEDGIEDYEFRYQVDRAGEFTFYAPSKDPASSEGEDPSHDFSEGEDSSQDSSEEENTFVDEIRHVYTCHSRWLEIK